MKNSIGRELPDFIESYGDVTPYAGPITAKSSVMTAPKRYRPYVPGTDKVLKSIEEAVERSGVRSGMTISFHHHFRNGDTVVNLVMEAIAKKGIKDIHLAASGLFPVHAPLVRMMEEGIITKVTTSTFNPGEVAKAVTKGKLRDVAVMMSHGGRARAIECGDLHIDVAFIAESSSDAWGNLNGSHGKCPCGVLSYAYADAQFADTVVAITDTLVPYPNCPIAISQHYVDFVVVVDSSGDSSGIESGTTKITTDPVRLQIANSAADLIEVTGYLKQGFSFQTGASGVSLAVAANVRERMKKYNLTGSFGLGGIHAYFVQMLEEGLFQGLLDVQCFDLAAVESIAKNPGHQIISGSHYANPHNASSVVNALDVVILGATEIDTQFNVNVNTSTEGVILGASGGHNDCAAGSKLTIIVTPLTRKTFCMVRDAVTTVTTPGETIDALVTDHGIAINPLRKDLLEAVKGTDLRVLSIQELKEIGESIVGPQTQTRSSGKIVGVVEYRDGTVIDVVRCVE